MEATEFASHEWWEKYKETVNQDPEMQTRGHSNFDENFYVEVGEERFLVRMDEGRVRDVIPNPTLNHEWAFGVEGDLEAWEEFVSEVPPPFNHEMVASHYRTEVRGDDGHLKMTGDNKRIFQNLRPFQRALDLMREAHAEGGAA